VRLYVADEFLDLEDIENPIQSYLNTRMQFQLINDMFYMGNVYIQRNEYELYDSILPFTDCKCHTVACSNVL